MKRASGIRFSILVAISLSLPLAVVAQKRDRTANGDVGAFHFGVRNTISTFSTGERNYQGTGVGGHLRFKLAEHLILESYGDYLVTNVGGLAQRMDTHGGFSVAPYLFLSSERRIVPYPIAGFCVDYSRFLKIGMGRDADIASNVAERYSFATQIGGGCQFRITDRLDFTPFVQYMIHIGNEVDINIVDNDVVFIEEKSGQLEGHLLFTMSVNYKVADLW